MDGLSDVNSACGDQDERSAYVASWIQHTVEWTQDKQSAYGASCDPHAGARISKVPTWLPALSAPPSPGAKGPWGPLELFGRLSALSVDMLPLHASDAV